VSVAVWWAVFSIPLFRDIPEPPAATLQHQGRGVVMAGFRSLRVTLSEVRSYRELFKFLLAFLIYNDGIGTIIGIAAIYGAELGFGSVELVLALLLVQFVGIPYSLIFGRLPDPAEPRRPIFLAFILYSAVVLPIVGRWGAVALPPVYANSLGWALGGLLGLEALGLILALLLGRALFSGLAARLDTRRSILLSLGVYAIIAIWAYFLNSLIEFWFLAWMVAIVQGGSQALSRSLYSALTPAAKSGEFFGFFGIMEKFSAFIGPLLFAAAGTIFGSSRPAVISLIALFIGGGYLLTRVDVAAGRAVAQAVDRELLGHEA
jgi:UMF1 family MFS transporter